ncbi:MAG: succinate dehydrogenase assembly factor 2 [Stellaceae bacterium]
MTDPAEIRRKRLLFRSWHRGTREADLLLGPFADRYLGELSSAEIDRYEALLAESDGALYDWLAGRVPPPAAHDTPLFRRLQSFRRLPRSA